MNKQANSPTATRLAVDDTIADLLKHPAFAGFSRLLLPWDDRAYDGRMRLQSVGSCSRTTATWIPRTSSAG